MSTAGRARNLPAPDLGPELVSARPSRVVAVVGGALDATVLDLALALSGECRACLDLLLLAEAPALFPFRAFAERILAPAAEEALARAERACAEVPGESQIVICRDLATALMAEIRARGATDLVLSAPSGPWWRRWRLRRAIARLRAIAECRVYVVHTRLPEAAPATIEPSGRAVVQ